MNAIKIQITVKYKKHKYWAIVEINSGGGEVVRHWSRFTTLTCIEPMACN